MVNNRIHSRILVIDDEERVREDLCAMFELLGYDIEVATGSGSALLNNAKSHARKFRPHVVIVDLRLLLNEADRSGIKLIEDLGPAHCVLYSAYITPEISRQLANFKTAGWAGKEEDPQNLVDLVNRVARDASASQKNFRIEKNSVSFKKISYDILGRDADVPPSLIEDILCQLFPDTSGVNVETLEGSVKTPTSVHRGHSAILRVERKGRITPVIVKVAKEDDIAREYKNYKNFIEGNLKGTFNAILNGEPRIFWDLGAVVYNFLGSDQGMSEFSVFYKKEKDSDVILRPLQTFFGEVWHGLYSRENREISTPLYSAYDRFLKLQKRLTNFLDQKEYRVFRGLDINLLNPVAWVLKHKTASTILNAHQAITHGDLHGDNIFVDGIHAWVIDFERSGWGHILRDFAELEIDIVTRLAWKKDHKELKEPFLLITHLVDPHYPGEDSEPADLLNDPELRKAFNVISGLRQIAQDTTRFDDFREYIWSLLFDAVFVVTHTPEGDPQHERALLYGSVLCSRLQQWGKVWPPEEWKPFLAGVQGPVEIIPAKIASTSLQENSENVQEPSRKITESAIKRLPLPIMNIVGASVFIVIGTVMIMALLRVMSLSDSTWQQILAVFVFLSLLTIIALALLGLVKGPTALDAIMKMFPTLFSREIRSSDKESLPSGDTNNDKFEG
jgi:CheY-like chemotaxis protein